VAVVEGGDRRRREHKESVCVLASDFAITVTLSPKRTRSTETDRRREEKERREKREERREKRRESVRFYTLPLCV
jgi:hypothetical protein